MMHVIPKWKVIYNFHHGAKQTIIYLHDDHYNNILRKAAEVSFDFELKVTQIIIELVDLNKSDSSLTSTSVK